MDTFFCEIGMGTRLHVCARALWCGRDLSITICGGEREHIGAVSLAVYEPERDSATVSTVTVFTHRDDQISASAAKRMSSVLQCTVCVSAGIHIDDPTPAELDELLKHCDYCLSVLETDLLQSQP